MRGRARVLPLVTVVFVVVIAAVVAVVLHRATAPPPPAVEPGRSIGALETTDPFGTGLVPRAVFSWPVKPFDHAHVLRATFGEPRGLQGVGGPHGDGAARARYLDSIGQIAPLGNRSLHTGVDIVAADGTPVYAVTSGVAVTADAGYDTHVVVGDFAYWHLAEAVPTGSPVTAFTTVIGRVYPGQGHVHLTRYASSGDDGLTSQPVNPLVSGGLTPYRDTAPPVLGHLEAFDPAQRPMAGDRLRGPVVLAVNAADIQSDGHTRTGLYTLAYRLVDAGGRTVMGPTGVFTFQTLPPAAVAARLYTTASTRDRYRTAFWYRLSDRTPSGDGFLHTERLTPGSYTLEITASDARANDTVRSYPLRVLAP